MNVWIADAGGTKTSWLSQKGEWIEGPGINPNTLTEEAISQRIPEEVQNSAEALHFYGAGCSSNSSVLRVEKALRTGIQGLQQLEINHDILGACRALCGRTPGIAAILGTGSNSAWYNGQRIEQTVASPGHLFADEGGGTWLGKRLLLAYFRGDFSPELLQHWNATYPAWNADSLIQYAYSTKANPAWFASFVPFLRTHALEFDEVKTLILNGFLAFVEQHLKRYVLAKPLPIHVTGSVGFYFQDLLKETLGQHGFQLGNVVRRPIEGLAIYHGIQFPPSHA
jgi:N-acetylglucosamine kinase-like BadF-type ATPase